MRAAGRRELLPAAILAALCGCDDVGGYPPVAPATQRASVESERALVTPQPIAAPAR